jgi:hypothetical protein
MAAYGKAVDSAEQKSCNTKLGKPLAALNRSCESDLKALDARYAGYAPEIHAVAEMQALRARHLKLVDASKEIAYLASLDELAKPYRRVIESMEKTSCVLAEAWRHDKCGEDLSTADNIWSKIPKQSQSEQSLAELRARHETLSGIQAQMAKAFEANRDAKVAGQVLEAEFAKATEDLPWNHLASGKAGQGGQVSDVNSMGDDSMLRFRQLATDCKGKFAPLVKDSAERQAYCELAQYAEKYRNIFAAHCYQSYLNAEIQKAEEIFAKFKQHKVVEGQDLNQFTKGFKAYSQTVIQSVSQRFQAAGLPLPSYERLLALEAQFKPLLTAAIANNKWTSHQYTAPSAPLKSLASSAAQKEGMTMLKIGVVDKSWTIDKNAFGVPIHKYQGGYVLLKSGDEAFCRMQYVNFIRAYQGSDYVAASAVSVFSTVAPTACK